MKTQKWDVSFSSYTHEIVFEGTTFLGKANIRVDGFSKEYDPVLVKGIGLFYPMMVDGSEIILWLDLRYKVRSLIMKGIDLDTNLPVDLLIMTAFIIARRSPQSVALMKSKETISIGAYGIFVILTFLDLFLLLGNADFYFPFSAFVPQLLLSLGLSSPGSYPAALLIILILAAFTIATVYLLLAVLSFKKTWSILVAFILVAVDSIILVIFLFNGYISGIKDIIFHALVLWAMLNLFLTRRVIDIKMRTPDIQMNK